MLLKAETGTKLSFRLYFPASGKNELGSVDDTFGLRLPYGNFLQQSQQGHVFDIYEKITLSNKRIETISLPPDVAFYKSIDTSIRALIKLRNESAALNNGSTTPLQ